MIGQTFDIDSGGKTYTMQQQDNFVSLEINAILQTLIKVAGLDDDEELDSVNLQRGFKGPVVDEVKQMIIKCSHTPKLTKESVLEIKAQSIPTIFLKIYNNHFGVAKDKKKELPKSSNTQSEKSELSTEK
jgi:hypothetical protein